MSSPGEKFSRALYFINATETERANWSDKDEKESFIAVTGYNKYHACNGQIALNKHAIDSSNTEVKDQRRIVEASHGLLQELKENAVYCEVEKEMMDDEFEEIERRYVAMKAKMDLKLEALRRAESKVEEQYARYEDASNCLEEKNKGYERLLSSIDEKFGWFGAGTDHELYYDKKKGDMNVGGKRLLLSDVAVNQFFDAVDPHNGIIEDVIETKWVTEQQKMFRRLLVNCGWDQNPLFLAKHDRLRFQKRPEQDASSFQRETLQYLPERPSTNKLNNLIAPTNLANASPLPSPRKRRNYDDIMSDEEREEVRELLALPPMSPVNKRRRMHPSTPLQVIREENTVDLKGPLIPTPDDVFKHKDI